MRLTLCHDATPGAELSRHPLRWQSFEPETMGEKAKASGIEMIVRFVRHLNEDWIAVENAVKQDWSNGPTEGHINRLKTLKRGM